MKKTLLTSLIVLVALNIFAQDISGKWYGVLNIQGTKLRLIFDITNKGDNYSSTMYSIDQTEKGIPVTRTSFENSKLKLEIPKGKVEYLATFQDNKFIGNFTQSGKTSPLNLSREKIEKEKIVRPQEPTKPYPYYSEDVVFENKKEKFNLSGTLTLPSKEGKFPVVVLISGSGPENRDSEIFNHKPFLVLADYLTKNGIGVLRFDDRGTAESKGDFKTATTLDFASDVASAVEYLKTRNEIDRKKIGLIGHSEGGMIAPIVATKSKDVKFIVLLAGPGMQIAELMLLQEELVYRAMGINEEKIQKGLVIKKEIFNIIKNESDLEKSKIDLTNYSKQILIENPDILKTTGQNEDSFIKANLSFLEPWFRFFIKYNPAIVLKDVKCPVLALNGEKDLQVPAKLNLEAIKKGLEEGKNKYFEIKELPNLNHLFQECKTGSPTEYTQIEQTFSPSALVEISQWVLKQVK